MTNQPTKNKPTASRLEEIRELYVTGTEDATGDRVYPSIESLAKDFNVAVVTLFRKAREGDWKEQRQIFEKKLAEEKDAKKREMMVKESVEFDARNLNLAKAMQGQITHLLSQGARAIASNNTAKPFSPESLTKLATALISVQKIGRLALGDSTDNTRIDAQFNDENTARQVDEILEQLAEAKRNSEKAIH
tara:strand:- start:23027 stop:23599 length:573 start_codon:yes stop_codon:yes gene_type:complete